MKTLLWLDDVRDPHKNDWLNFSPIERPFEVFWVKSYFQFIDWIVKNGLPDAICFDHDLGEDVAREKMLLGMSKRRAKKEKRNTKTGLDCAKWLIYHCSDYNLPMPRYNIHSANPVGAENIRSLLLNFANNR